MVQTGFIIGVGLVVDTFVGAHHHRAGHGGVDGARKLAARQGNSRH